MNYPPFSTPLYFFLNSPPCIYFTICILRSFPICCLYLYILLLHSLIFQLSFTSANIYPFFFRYFFLSESAVLWRLLPPILPFTLVSTFLACHTCFLPLTHTTLATQTPPTTLSSFVPCPVLFPSNPHQ